ncbi:MAG TPA: serine/threonine-protein kinase [Bacteroidota bacterium]|nr:serine/threonine-protein kinase [Bacteroidota bacterium]
MARISMLQIGDQFDHFQIQAHIAQGGMSDIYRAFDLLTSKEVVLKIPDKMSIGDPAQYERFQRELEVMRTLQHPAILKGLGSGRFNSTPYLVTELIEGESMRSLVARAAPMPPAEAVGLIRKIADGIAHCHDNQIIHRDIKPENILITAAGQPVVLDFGLALTKKSFRVTYANLSSTAGTPDYMAPEQIEGQRGDVRTDIYAVGTMLFELLTGRTPYSGDSNLAVMAQHLSGNIPRLDKIQSGISPQLAAVVAKSLQREPKDRYSDMHQFVHDLDNLEQVDISILDRVKAPSRTRAFLRSPVARTIVSTVILIGVIVILAFVLKSMH